MTIEEATFKLQLKKELYIEQFNRFPKKLLIGVNVASAIYPEFNTSLTYLWQSQTIRVNKLKVVILTTLDPDAIVFP